MNHERFLAGVRLFNQGKFYDAHEVLEDVWRPLPKGPARQFLQGLIQFAVALHHHSKGNLAGATSLLMRAERNVKHGDVAGANLNAAAILEAMEQWKKYFHCGGAVPAGPRLLPPGET